MAILKPFRGILFNPHKVVGDDVVCPPYDVISEELREELYKKSPYNIIRIDYAKNDPSVDKYKQAREFLQIWTEQKILIRDHSPRFYGYEIDYEYKKKRKTLRGLIGLVRLEELGKGIFPHEQTYSKPKADRLNLMKSCMANTSLIFSIYRSHDRITSKILEKLESPHLEARDLSGNIHRIYKIPEQENSDIIEEFKDKAIFIADGHHRYEVALEFKSEMESIHGTKEDAPWNYVMMFLANVEDQGYMILPTHRLLSTLLPVKELIESQEYLRLSPIEEEFSDIEEYIEQRGPSNFGLYIRDKKWYVLQYVGPSIDYLPPEIRNLDVTILEEAILKRLFPTREICYDIDIKKGVNMVNENKCDAIFVLRATNVEDIERVAKAGLRMPPKSTYFYPKLLTGMIINSFE